MIKFIVGGTAIIIVMILFAFFMYKLLSSDDETPEDVDYVPKHVEQPPEEQLEPEEPESGEYGEPEPVEEETSVVTAPYEQPDNDVTLRMIYHDGPWRAGIIDNTLTGSTKVIDLLHGGYLNSDHVRSAYTMDTALSDLDGHYNIYTTFSGQYDGSPSKKTAFLTYKTGEKNAGETNVTDINHPSLPNSSFKKHLQFAVHGDDAHTSCVGEAQSPFRRQTVSFKNTNCAKPGWSHVMSF